MPDGHDVRRSAALYVEKLGFRIVQEPPGWAFVKRDNVTIVLGECPNDMHPSELGCHSYFAYLVVDDAGAYHAEVKDKGVEHVSEIEDKPWGMREYGIQTVDGHRITIGQQI